MEQVEDAGAQIMVRKVVFAVFAGLVVLVLLFPASGVDTLPPECSSVFGYTVPCGGGTAVIAGAATAGLVGLWLWVKRIRP